MGCSDAATGADADFRKLRSWWFPRHSLLDGPPRTATPGAWAITVRNIRGSDAYQADVAPAGNSLVLLSLFSSVAAHSAKNGLPPRKLAGLFSPYAFGLRHDRSFDETYQEWQRCTLALEHILLAYLRFQATSALLPTFLQSFLAGYPDSLGLAQGSTSKTSTGARLEETTRVKRIVRFHSRDLIRQAGSYVASAYL